MAWIKTQELKHVGSWQKDGSIFAMASSQWIPKRLDLGKYGEGLTVEMATNMIC